MNTRGYHSPFLFLLFLSAIAPTFVKEPTINSLEVIFYAAKTLVDTFRSTTSEFKLGMFGHFFHSCCSIGHFFDLYAHTHTHRERVWKLFDLRGKQVLNGKM